MDALNLVIHGISTYTLCQRRKQHLTIGSRSFVNAGALTFRVHLSSFAGLATLYPFLHHFGPFSVGNPVVTTRLMSEIMSLFLRAVNALERAYGHLRCPSGFLEMTHIQDSTMRSPCVIPTETVAVTSRTRMQTLDLILAQFDTRARGEEALASPSPPSSEVFCIEVFASAGCRASDHWLQWRAQANWRGMTGDNCCVRHNPTPPSSQFISPSSTIRSHTGCDQIAPRSRSSAELLVTKLSHIRVAVAILVPTCGPAQLQPSLRFGGFVADLIPYPYTVLPCGQEQICARNTAGE